jgi:hypothetical protein
MASDFSVAWQCFSKRTIFFLLRIKLHALIQLGVSPPSFELLKGLFSNETPVLVYFGSPWPHLSGSATLHMYC